MDNNVTGIPSIIILNHGSINTDVKVRICKTFASKLRGLMFEKNLAEDNGIILIENKASRLNTSIHMMFMNFDLAVLWLDTDFIIVDKVLAKRWVPIYVPKKPAQYVVELHQKQYTQFNVGDKLVLEL